VLHCSSPNPAFTRDPVLTEWTRRLLTWNNQDLDLGHSQRGGDKKDQVEPCKLKGLAVVGRLDAESSGLLLFSQVSSLAPALPVVVCSLLLWPPLAAAARPPALLIGRLFSAEDARLKHSCLHSAITFAHVRTPRKHGDHDTMQISAARRGISAARRGAQVGDLTLVAICRSRRTATWRAKSWAKAPLLKRSMWCG
jgi:hypothetical protein